MSNHTNFIVYTLIDITDSKITNPRIDSCGFYQYQNLNTFIQTISLRTQPFVTEVTEISTASTELLFGNSYNATKAWKLEFTCDNSTIWNKGNNPLYFLYEDFNNVPVHVNLTEDVHLNSPVINTCSELIRNTYFYIR